MRKQRIVTVSVLFLAVEVEGERLTLAVIVFDHDFERLSFGGECVVIEGEMPRRDSIAIVRREGFTASADAQRPSAVVLEREFDLSNRQERGRYNLLGGVDGGLFVEKGESSQSR